MQVDIEQQTSMLEVEIKEIDFIEDQDQSIQDNVRDKDHEVTQISPLECETKDLDLE